jgi:cephalosporin-C deacetylase-like acetyl esterase
LYVKNDFDEFWRQNFQNLRSVNSNYQLEKIESSDSLNIDLFSVSIKSYNNVVVRGYLEMPKKKGKYPALFRVPGYTEALEPLNLYDDMIVFSLNVRNHGISDDEYQRAYDMWVQNINDKDKFFYKGVFLDCIAGLDFVCSLEQVDQDRIAVWGASQGGGLSMFVASMDQRIDLCISDIPFLTDWQRYFEISHWEELDKWMGDNANVKWSEILDVLSYYDTKNMVDRIECPVWMGIGLQDDVCPPATSFASFNRINTEKSYVIYPNEYHWQPQEHYDMRFKQLRAYFKLK